MHTNKIIHWGILCFAITLGAQAVATEQLPYETIKSDKPFELRQYDAYLQAKVTVDAKFNEAGSEAFRTLFRYIDGGNTQQQSVAMTTPVTQRASTSQKIAMTAPVIQQAASSQEIAMTAPVTQQLDSGGQFEVAFVMPSKWTLETLPVPTDERIEIEQVTPQQTAVVRYSGGWSEKKYKKHLGKLQQWINEQGYKVAAEPVWARYNPPFMPWFMRRNEILIRVVKN
ncbi:MAG: heme-binding protein [Gammaproteobacteria bacterium]|nr:heme-binding protein [Gammaproteobacteria bacterium]